MTTRTRHVWNTVVICAVMPMTSFRHAPFPVISRSYLGHVSAISRSYPSHVPEVMQRSYLDHIKVISQSFPGSHVTVISRSYPGNISIISRSCPDCHNRNEKFAIMKMMNKFNWLSSQVRFFRKTLMLTLNFNLKINVPNTIFESRLSYERPYWATHLFSKHYNKLV